MAIQILVTQSCDRCQKPFEERSVKYGEGVPTLPRSDVLKLLRGDEVLFRFEDLCDECSSVVEQLVKRLRLEGLSRRRQTDVPVQGEPVQEHPAPQSPETKPVGELADL